MNDFISLSCPSCGGHLKLDSKTREYTCDYCGTNHRVRNEDIEFFGRCPICKRNDKVEKVTALIHKQDGMARLFPEPEFPNNYLEYRPEPEPEPLAEPQYEYVPRKKWNIYQILGLSSVILTLIMLISMFTSGNSSPAKQIFLLLSMFAFIICAIGSLIFLMTGFGVDTKASDLNYSEKKAKWKEDNQKIREDWENRERIANKGFQKGKEFFSKKYSFGMERYNLLYYCYRDDCIFIPSESDYASSSNYKEFIYKGMN